MSRSPAAEAATRAGVRLAVGLAATRDFTADLSLTVAAFASSLCGGLAFLAMSLVASSMTTGARVDASLSIVDLLGKCK